MNLEHRAPLIFRSMFQADCELEPLSSGRPNPFFSGEKVRRSFNVGLSEPLHQDSGMVFKPKVLVANAPREFRWIGHVGIPAILDGELYFRLEETDSDTRFVQGEKFRGLLDYFMDMRPIAQSFDAVFRSAQVVRLSPTLGKQRRNYRFKIPS